jgi:hypothetical protein
MFKVKTKKEFHFEVEGQDEINKCFDKMNDCIEDIDDRVGNNLAYHRKDFFDRFKGEMYNIHANFRNLQESTNEGMNALKLKKEILDRQAERDWFKNECSKIDNKCHEKQVELLDRKGIHGEYL